MEKSTLVISRKWNNPEIMININNEEISLSINLDDFIEALIKEIGSITYTFKQTTFENQVKTAKDRVLSGIKEESLKVIK